jgi:hypothetical protein
MKEVKKKEITLMKTKVVKSITSSLLFACALFSLVAAAMGSGASGIARADSSVQGCSVQTLRGSYLFATHGWNIVGGVAVPKAIVEGIDSNGDGTLVSPFATVSINGNIIHSSGSVGSYTVAADCTGTLTFTGGASFDIFVEPTGKQLWMIQTGPPAVPAVFEGMATRVSPAVSP